jgi:acetyltransferase
MLMQPMRDEGHACGGIAALRVRDGRRVFIRPVLPSDAARVQAFVRALSRESRRNRFFYPIAELSPDQLARMTRASDPRELALVAYDAAATTPSIVATAQYAICEDECAEYAIAVADAWQRQGLGERLTELLLGYAKAMGLKAICGVVLDGNTAMLRLTAKLGFTHASHRDRALVAIERALAAA